MRPVALVLTTGQGAQAKNVPKCKNAVGAFGGRNILRFFCTRSVFTSSSVGLADMTCGQFSDVLLKRCKKTLSITWHLFSKWKPTVPEIQPLADEGPSEELCQAQEGSLEYEQECVVKVVVARCVSVRPAKRHM